MPQDACARFRDRECAPCYADWGASGSVPRARWLKAGDMGLLGAAVPEEYGGAGEREGAGGTYAGQCRYWLVQQPGISQTSLSFFDRPQNGNQNHASSLPVMDYLGASGSLVCRDDCHFCQGWCVQREFQLRNVPANHRCSHRLGFAGVGNRANSADINASGEDKSVSCSFRTGDRCFMALLLSSPSTRQSLPSCAD